MPKSPEPPITRADLEAMEQRITEAVRAAEQRLTDKTQEFVRDAQTELLRAFAAYSGAESILLRKLKADVSNIDASTEGRITILEQRLREIEKRLLLHPPAA
jgi:deoxyadenosine/deoxycytidine kinase